MKNFYIIKKKKNPEIKRNNFPLIKPKQPPGPASEQ